MVVYVTVDEPYVEDQSSSGLGTIIAQRIFAELLPYMNIYQTETGESAGDPNVGDQVAMPIYTGDIPEDEQQDASEANSPETSAEGVTEATTEAATEITTEAITESTTEQGTESGQE